MTIENEISLIAIPAPGVYMPGYLDDRRDTVALLGDVGDEGGPSLYDLLQGHLHFDDADVAVLERAEVGANQALRKFSIKMC